MMRRPSICGIAVIFAATMIAADTKPAEPAFHKELKQVATEYLKWGRADDEVRWAPELCRSPLPGRVYSSESDDTKTHGRKLYSLFAKDRASYVRTSAEQKAAAGQVIVKQSWHPEEVLGPSAAELAKLYKDRDIAFSPHVIITTQSGAKSRATSDDHFLPYVIRDDKVYKASKQAELFIMMKVDPKTSDTDNGWVYGTVSPDGNTVTSAGKIESCMKCHVKAKYDRLFGLPEKK